MRILRAAYARPVRTSILLFYGEFVSFSTVARLHYRLEEEGPLPYYFDIVDYTHLTHKDLQEDIGRVGKTIFERTEGSEMEGSV